MEAKATQQIMEKSTLVLDDTTIKLVIDEQGKAELEVTKGEKTLKSIPDKYKKDKQVEVLKDNKSYLTKQYSRTRLSLEQAMLSQSRHLRQMTNFLSPTQAICSMRYSGICTRSISLTRN